MIQKRNDKINDTLTASGVGGSANDNMKVFFVVEGKLTYSTCD